MDIPKAPSPRRLERRLIPWVLGVGAVLTLGATTLLEPAARTFSSDQVVLDTVVRGDLVREIRGAGRLVAEEQLLIPAPASGRVERRLVEPGATVDTGAVLLELSNPEIDLQLLEAARELAEARATRLRLQSTHRLQRLSEEDGLTSLRTQGREADRQLRVARALADSHWISSGELEAAVDRHTESRRRIELAELRIAAADSAFQTELLAQDGEIERVARITDFHRSRVAAMTVRSGASGIVQEIAAEQGEWVMAGRLLARVFQPGRLRALLEVPEGLAGEILPGQPARLLFRNDTIRGVVRQVAPASVASTVAIQVAILDPLPSGLRPDLRLEGVVEVGRLDHVLHVRRPGAAGSGARVALYRMVGASSAELIPVQLGPGSADRVSIASGADAGDVLIVSDMSSAEGATTIRIRH